MLLMSGSKGLRAVLSRGPNMVLKEGKERERLALGKGRGAKQLTGVLPSCRESTL